MITQPVVRIEAVFSRSDDCRAVDAQIRTAISERPGPEGIQVRKRGETPITVQDLEQVVQYLLSAGIEPDTLTMELTEPAVTVTMVDGRLEADHEDGSVELALEAWNTRSTEPMDAGVCIKTLTGHGNQVLGVATSPDGTIVTASPDGTVKQWDSANGQCIRTMTHGCYVYAVAVSPDGSTHPEARWSVRRALADGLFTASANELDPEVDLNAASSRFASAHAFVDDIDRARLQMFREEPIDIALADDVSASLASIAACEEDLFAIPATLSGDDSAKALPDLVVELPRVAVRQAVGGMEFAVPIFRECTLVLSPDALDMPLDDLRPVLLGLGRVLQLMLLDGITLPADMVSDAWLVALTGGRVDLGALMPIVARALQRSVAEAAAACPLEGFEGDLKARDDETRRRFAFHVFGGQLPQPGSVDVTLHDDHRVYSDCAGGARLPRLEDAGQMRQAVLDSAPATAVAAADFYVIPRRVPYSRAEINTLAEQNDILQTCRLVTLGRGAAVDVPVYRRCPTCGELTTREGDLDSCKMSACRCGQDFCHKCLLCVASQEEHMAHYGGECEMAPRQTVDLPEGVARLRTFACPHCHRSATVSANRRQLACRGCGNTVCLGHDDPVIHDGSCEHYDEMLANRLGYRRCPGCGVRYYKDGGCQHMRCRCGQTWNE
ncbi:WD domain G-beta repeat [Carpediemonas membranifera]|uniref:WD domain G-beta repeat n=1 Tax=Carpediemonas membranifera TaxID=201153 RepID=A0A8J6E8U1_9EUKA|nr:WD domain G-beta repeat [Carpediemonas membranifera]|eukprot:KAG9392395.1 WD domain G-beta repeat [Carpediemonas membranifera]